MAVQLIQYGPAIESDTFREYFRRGLHRSRLTPGATGVGFLFEEFDEVTGNAPSGWTFANGGSGAIDRQLAGLKGGVVQYKTGATGSSVAEIYTDPSIISRQDTDKWYMAWRKAIITTPDANTRAAMYVRNIAGNKMPGIGVFGGSSTANFVMQHSGNVAGSGSTYADMGVAIDTSMHVFELYSVGDGVIRGRIDGGAEVTSTPASPPTDANHLMLDIRNGATAANQAINIDWLLCVYPR